MHSLRPCQIVLLSAPAPTSKHFASPIWHTCVRALAKGWNAGSTWIFQISLRLCVKKCSHEAFSGTGRSPNPHTSFIVVHCGANPPSRRRKQQGPVDLRQLIDQLNQMSVFRCTGGTPHPWATPTNSVFVTSSMWLFLSNLGVWLRNQCFYVCVLITRKRWCSQFCLQFVMFLVYNFSVFQFIFFGLHLF